MASKTIAVKKESLKSKKQPAAKVAKAAQKKAAPAKKVAPQAKKVVLKVVSQKKAAPKKAKAPKKLSYEALIVEHRENGRKLGRSILRKWNVKISQDEIDSLVDLALCESAQRYRYDRGASFMTFFYYHLRGYLVRSIAAATTNSNIFVSNVNSIGLEISENTTVTAESPIWCVSDTVLNRQADAETPESLILKKEEYAQCGKLLGQLDQVEQEVVTRALGADEPIMEVAKALGYSRCHVSRVKQKALNKLRALAASDDPNIQIIDMDEDFSDDASEERSPLKRKRGRTRRSLAVKPLAKFSEVRSRKIA